MIGTSGSRRGQRETESARCQAPGRPRPSAALPERGAIVPECGAIADRPEDLEGPPVPGLDPDGLAAVLERGRGRLVLVTGERGVGRSRVVTRILDRVRSSSDVMVITGHATVGNTGVRPAGDDEVSWPGSSLPVGSAVVPARATAAVPSVDLVPDLVDRAARRPVTIVLEDIHLATEGTHALVDRLLASVGTAPLLVVVTAATGWAARGPDARSWCRWVGRPAVLHLPVGPPSRSQLLAVLGEVCRDRIGGSDLDGIAAAACGNPRIAQEIALWTLDGSRADGVPADCLVRELVAAHDGDGVLGVLAVAGAAVDTRLISSVARTSTTRAREVLDRAAAAGLVDRRGMTGSGDAYRTAHPMFAAAACSALPAPRMQELHLAIATTLIARHREDPACAPDIARHLIAADRPRSDTAIWCLRGATWCEAVARLRDATTIAQAGLDMDPDPVTRIGIVRVLARCYRRLGDFRSAAGVLRAQLRAVAGQDACCPEVVVELLELHDQVTVPDAESLLDDARNACPPDRLDLMARLTAIEAAIAFRRNPSQGRRIARRAVRAASSVDDRTAQVRSHAVAAQTLMDPAHLGDLERIGVQLMRQPVVDGLAATAAAALADADRGRLDSVVREYSWRENRWPDRATRDELLLLRAVSAALDGRRTALVRVMGQLSASTTPRVALQTSLLPALWAINTRSEIDEHVPDLTEVPGAVAMDELHWLGTRLCRSGPLHPLEVDLIRRRLGSPEELIRPREDGTWTTRVAAAAVFGAITRDPHLCTVTVRALEAYVDQFVVVWPFVPVGPVGWFLATSLWAIGRHQEALSALAAAQEASEHLGAPAWILRVAAERARLLRDGTATTVDDLVRATIGPAQARRFPGILAELRCRLGEQPTEMLAPYPQSAGRCRPPVPLQTARPDSAKGGPAEMLRLTPRESDIMGLAAVGCTNREIARRLFLSVATVERHCTNLYRRLGVRNRAQALGILGRWGLTGGDV